MKRDESRLLYEKYLLYSNTEIEFTLKSGSLVKGYIISYCKGDPDAGEPLVIQWHIVPAEHKLSLGQDTFGFLVGELVNQSDIVAAHFKNEEDSI